MSEMWQQIAVWTMVGLAGLWAVWTGISAWRAFSRGECGHCPGCSPEPQEPQKSTSDRIAFLPADSLRNSKRAGEKSNLN